MNEDYISAGFHRLDSKLIERRSPKIQWGALYLLMEPAEKIDHLQKLAATMNHAAYLIQEERNELGRLLELKEQQLIKMAEAVRANNAMLQQQVTQMNEDRQGFNATVAKLNGEIKALRATGNGHID